MNKPNEFFGNQKAPDGHVYVCGACGRVSRWKYGLDFSGKHDSTPGWDLSCAINSLLTLESAIESPANWVYPKRVKKLIPPEP
jgi:hypothetical protein